MKKRTEDRLLEDAMKAYDFEKERADYEYGLATYWYGRTISAEFRESLYPIAFVLAITVAVSAITLIYLFQ